MKKEKIKSQNPNPNFSIAFAQLLQPSACLNGLPCNIAYGPNGGAACCAGIWAFVVGSQHCNGPFLGPIGSNNRV